MTFPTALRLALPALLAAVTAPAIAAPAAPAATPAGAYTIDPAHSSIEFRIRHLVSRVPGRFGAFTGTLSFDPAHLATTQVQVDIDAASINTDQAKRDAHLKSADFFEVAKYPRITFKSTSVTPVDATHARLTGDLTIKGITRPVTLDAEVLGVAPGMGGETRAGFQAHGTINRTDYNVVWNRALEGGGSLLGDEVEIVLGVEAIKPGAGGAAPKKG